MCVVAIDSQHRLVFGNGLCGTAPRAQYVAFGHMRSRTTRRRRQGSVGQRFRADEVRRLRVAHTVEHAHREFAC